MNDLKEALTTNLQSVTQHPNVVIKCVNETVQRYLSSLGKDETPFNLYHMILNEVEAPLFETVLQLTKGNQSKTARILGLSRGTLRTKLRKYFDNKKPGKEKDY